ncbi:MAG: hypothetical protein M1817_004017 [Caeruleum heppii]|nr:MAG: hypothetical protein M1817_004017 [Caeruleum heppii]
MVSSVTATRTSSTTPKRKAGMTTAHAAAPPAHTTHTSGSSVSKRRKVGPTTAATPKNQTALVDLTEPEGPYFQNGGKTASKPGKATSKTAKDDGAEKRLRMFRKKPSGAFQERYERVLTQRMFVIDRVRTGTEDVPEETFDMAGTTGNIYSVHISQRPTCTCPDHRQKGNLCKHIIYVLVNVLKAPQHLQYQVALLSTELREIFANAPAAPGARPGGPIDDERAGHRKPVEGDCPICVLEFEPDKEEIVWCKAACGNNIHKECFQRWAASKAGEVVKCVFCRTIWQGDEESIKKISKTGPKNADGYVNVAAELGLSGHRDTSSYHQHWVRRTYGMGY